MLTDRVTLPSLGTDPEDYLSNSLGVIFPDDITNLHGDPSTPVIYTSPRHGTMELTMADPIGEDNRRLFSHHLWNAGVLMAVLIEDMSSASASLPTQSGASDPDLKLSDSKNLDANDSDPKHSELEGPRLGDYKPWDLHHQTVLELGAGTGIASLLAIKEAASEVIVTDYPAPEILSNIRANVARNVGLSSLPPSPHSITVEGHEWGILPPLPSPSLDDPTSLPSFPTLDHRHHFTRLVLADTLWLPSQHAALHRSIAFFLVPSTGLALVIAGFHSGRPKVAQFFDVETLAREGLVVERIWERDAVGLERKWDPDKVGEDIGERKRWLVVAVLSSLGMGGTGGEGT